MSDESFDFIVVGGGTAGIALAARLAEVRSLSILILEAGEDHTDDPRVKIPASYSALFGTEIDWGFRTVPQSTLNGRAISLNQGKTLGGSSCMNAHVYAPPTQAVLDGWVQLGNVGWDWDTMGAYYRKAFWPPALSEKLKSSIGIEHWGAYSEASCGPVKLSYPGNPAHPIRRLWAETFKELGYQARVDPWIHASVGAFSNLASIDPKTKERNHAAKAYLQSAPSKHQLKIVVGARVDKIMFEAGEVQPQAIGIQYYHEGIIKRVNVLKEVIVSAGALQSPKILELSGIGNPEILGRHGIEVVKSLPGVGENLQDHLVCDISYAAIDELETLDNLADQEPRTFADAVSRFSQNCEGLLTLAGIQTFAYLPIMHSPAWPMPHKFVDLVRTNRPLYVTTPDEVRAQKYYEIAENMLLQSTQASGAYLTAIGQNAGTPDPTGMPTTPQPGNYFTIAAVLAQPLSRGTVHIASADCADAPDIDPRYLSHPLDVEVFARHISYIETIAKSAPLSSVLKQPLQPISPLAHMTDLDSAKRYMECQTTSMWHPASTCAMLPEEIGGVVDLQLKVYGVSNLRVVDASVVPLLPPGNLQSTVYALAERAADMILKAHHKRI
ncbi:oxidoreductase [Astrocystis sublimbata]|nr:oxidoreductase [Astrocystis sublimbata]KAI0198333.1 oxidoreductase [Astrocystis sublimbata]